MAKPKPPSTERTPKPTVDIYRQNMPGSQHNYSPSRESDAGYTKTSMPRAQPNKQATTLTQQNILQGGRKKPGLQRHTVASAVKLGPPAPKRSSGSGGGGQKLK